MAVIRRSRSQAPAQPFDRKLVITLGSLVASTLTALSLTFSLPRVVSSVTSCFRSAASATSCPPSRNA
ncbi:hypothetical protein PJL18_03549 [Paenarthrobacter nicotinovorans]|nr:hypothetical protein [Paenarthrobacter nicotinovorans]